MWTYVEHFSDEVIQSRQNIEVAHLNRAYNVESYVDNAIDNGSLENTPRPEYTHAYRVCSKQKWRNVCIDSGNNGFTFFMKICCLLCT